MFGGQLEKEKWNASRSLQSQQKEKQKETNVRHKQPSLWVYGKNGSDPFVKCIFTKSLPLAAKDTGSDL